MKANKHFFMHLAPLALVLGLSSNPAIAHTPDSTDSCKEVLIGDTNKEIEIDDLSCDLLSDLNIHVISINTQVWEINGLNISIPCLDDGGTHTPEIAKDFHLRFETINTDQGTWVLWMNNDQFSHSIQSTGSTVTHIDETAIAEICKQ